MYRPSARFKKTLMGSGVALVLVGLNAPATFGFAKEQYHEYKISQPEYMAEYGSWKLAEVPERYRTNAIHAALLHTGKVLLVAGSGNDQEQFDAGTFETVLWDPAKNTYKHIPTPVDLFCGGHAQLPNGRLLVAGGTARYELLGDDVVRAGGGMVVKNEDPDSARTLPKGTRFRSPDGDVYVSVSPVIVPAAEKAEKQKGKKAKAKAKGKKPKKPKFTAGEARVFVEAEKKGEGSVITEPAQYRILGLHGEDARNLYGLAQELTLKKQDFQGIRDAYEFDPVAERYITVDPMDKARWYPTLVTLPDGKVLSVSGLDEVGEILQGENEIYDPESGKWSKAPTRYFPTYPALFLTKGGKLFYSGSNAGYGPADKGRTPGLWDLRNNTFEPVEGLTDPGRTETSSSLLLPPAQDQRVMILGGGGVGESAKSTPRTAVIDLTEPDPAYREGPSLPQGTRYLSSVILPDDQVFTTGGSEDYRGRAASDILKAQFYDPQKDTFRPAAAPTVGRNYHAEALLLPDGRVATFGSDPLFADKNNTRLGQFEQRIEVYSPPYLHGEGRERPKIGAGPEKLERGADATYRTAHPERIGKARLMRPSAVSHVTDVEQRSIELGIERGDGSLTVSIPQDPSLTPPGWYMLFLVDEEGTPSVAKWVHLP